MVSVSPFRALRPPAERAAAVGAPPYDVVDVEEARALAAGQPDNFLHVTRPEIDLPAAAAEATSADDAGAVELAGAGEQDGSPDRRVHDLGRAALLDLVRRGSLVLEAAPAVWVYRLEREGRAQTGVAACFAVDDYDSGVIRTHEHTRPDKEADRVAHIDALDAHDEPVLLLHRPDEDLRSLVDRLSRAVPHLEVLDPEGVRHVLWRCREPDVVAEVVRIFGGLEHLYVADGHHRTAAASRVRRLRLERAWGSGGEPGPAGTAAGPAGTNTAAATASSIAGIDTSTAVPGGTAADAGGSRTDEADVFLAVAFPADELTVLPYYRLVRDLDGLAPADVLRRLEPEFAVTPSDHPVEPSEPHAYGLYLDGTWYELRARPDAVEGGHPVEQLDVAVLQQYVLAPVFGIADPRTDPRLAFLGGVHGVAELQRRVDEGQAAVALTLRATTVEDLMAVSDAGEVMPPKSTWFEPKLRSGLLVHPLHPGD